MPSMGAALLNSLRSVERPGDFCVGGLREIIMPSIDIEGMGRIAFPLLPAQGGRLVAIAEAAPYGRGEDTVVDRDVRRTWQIDRGKVRIGGRHWDEATSVEYLKTLAIARIFLSNFLNVQSSWVTQGLKVCQMGLRFGGNDVGSVMIEENVVRSAGVTNCTTEEELRHMIRDAGFRPAQRDTLYRTYFLN